MLTRPLLLWFLKKLGFRRWADGWYGVAPGGLLIGERIQINLSPHENWTILCHDESISFVAFASLYLDVFPDGPDDVGISFWTGHVTVRLDSATGHYHVPWCPEGVGLIADCLRDPGLFGVLRDWLEDHPEYRSWM